MQASHHIQPEVYDKLAEKVYADLLASIQHDYANDYKLAYIEHSIRKSKELAKTSLIEYLDKRINDFRYKTIKFLRLLSIFHQILSKRK